MTMMEDFCSQVILQKEATVSSVGPMTGAHTRAHTHTHTHTHTRVHTHTKTHAHKRIVHQTGWVGSECKMFTDIFLYLELRCTSSVLGIPVVKKDIVFTDFPHLTNTSANLRL